MGYSYLRVMNDDIVAPGTGFELHPHKNMEIISFVVRGELTHGDSMGNKEVLQRGEIQYMSAGKGIYHSEYNNGKEELRFIQIWITPDKKGEIPNYGSKKFSKEERENKLLKIVSPKKGDAPIKINQNAEIYVSEVDADRELEVNFRNDEMLYFKLIEGEVEINGIKIYEKEGAEIYNESKLWIKANCKSLLLIIKME